MQYVFIILKGMAMGAADVVPGVSGGTIAFITGIYEKLINSIKAINLKSIKLLLQGKFLLFWETVNGTFLASLLTGIFISVLSLSKLLKYLLENHPILVWAFFFGLIIASAIYVAKQIKQWSVGTISSMLLGIIAAWYITIITPGEANTTWWYIILSGAIAICAMILPGISGSFILVLLGMYKFILDSVSSFNISVIALFMIGAVIGIISFSNIISWFLKKYYNLTIALLAGFMIGSLNKIWPWKKIIETFVDRHGEIKPLIEKNVFPHTYAEITGEPSLLFFAIILSILGFVLVFAIEGASKLIKHK